MIALAISALIAFLAGLTAFRFARWTGAIVAALFVLGSRGVLFAASERSAETIVIVLIAVALSCMIREQPNYWMQRTAGAALGISAMLHPVAVLIAAFLGAWLWRRHRRAFTPFGLGVAIAIIPMLLLNLVSTGRLIDVHPGTEFYEGMNPYATGYAGVPPAIVVDMETMPKHEAYRFVAVRAIGRDLSPAGMNRYWLGKALAYAFHAPAHAAKLAARKFFFAIKSYEPDDRGETLRGLRWIPFPLLLMFAITGLWLVRDREAVIPLGLTAVAGVVTLTLFSVTATQRALLVPSLAILAALAIARLVSDVREGHFAGAIGSLILVTVFTVALHRDGPAQREDMHRRIAAAQSARLLQEAENEPSGRERLRAMAATWTAGAEPDVPRATLREVALAGLPRARPPQRRFDFALSLALATDWNEAETVFATLQREGYVPMRGTQTTNSVAFHRSRALRRMGRRADYSEQLARAAEEQPGDVDILAARAVDGDPDAAKALDRLHDPFTRDLALGRAAWERGNRAEAEKVARQLISKMREWPRARKFATLVHSF